MFPYTVPQSKPLYCTSLAFTPTQIANEEDELGLWLCALSVRGQWYLGVMVGLGLGVMVAKGNGAKLISWCDTIHPPEPRSHKKPLYKLFNFSSKWLIIVIIIMISALMTANCWTCWHGGGVEWWEALDSSSHPYQPNNHTIVHFAQIYMWTLLHKYVWISWCTFSTVAV